MDPTLWVLVAIKIFIIFWLIYYIFERRKRKGSENNLVTIEEGMEYVFYRKKKNRKHFLIIFC